MASRLDKNETFRKAYGGVDPGVDESKPQPLPITTAAELGIFVQKLAKMLKIKEGDKEADEVDGDVLLEELRAARAYLKKEDDGTLVPLECFKDPLIRSAAMEAMICTLGRTMTQPIMDLSASRTTVSDRWTG